VEAVKVHGYEVDPGEVSRLMFEIAAGWEWGDPRSEIAQTAENEAVWNQLKAQSEDTGGFGFGTGDLAADGDQVERTYLAAKGRGRISALYMVEEGPDSLRDLVLRESGWVRTSTLADWRFGERSDIDEITRGEARRFAESVGLGQFVVDNGIDPDGQA
jgi:hypothetical protein